MRLRVALLLLVGSLLIPSHALGHTNGNNAGAWTKGATLKVFVDPIPGDAPAGTDGAVDEAIDAWNTAQAAYGGLMLMRAGATKANADIHISWAKNRASWGTTHEKDSVDKDNNGFTKDTVRIETEYNDGLTSDGIEGVLKHELGHAEGLGHSAASDLMKKDAFGGTKEGLNAGGDAIVPTADDNAGKKSLWGTVPKNAKANANSAVFPFGNQFQYVYTVTGEVFCDPNPCNGVVTFFAVEISDLVLTGVNLIPPPNWNAYLLQDGFGGPKPLDDVPRGSSLAVFETGPSFGIPPGGLLNFTIETPVPPVQGRVFTNSPSFDSDEFFLASPGPSNLPGLSEWGLLLLVLSLITAGALLALGREMTGAA